MGGWDGWLLDASLGFIFLYGLFIVLFLFTIF